MVYDDNQIVLRLHYGAVINTRIDGYTVSIEYYHPDWAIYTNKSAHDKLEQWCTDHNIQVDTQPRVFTFAHKSDAFAFMLRWQGSKLNWT